MAAVLCELTQCCHWTPARHKRAYAWIFMQSSFVLAIFAACVYSIQLKFWQVIGHRSDSQLAYNVQGLISEQHQYMLIYDTYGIQTRKRHVWTVWNHLADIPAFHMDKKGFPRKRADSLHCLGTDGLWSWSISIGSECKLSLTASVNVHA